MSSKYDQMGKNELRAACKAAGIAYGKLNNDGMRAALAKFDNGAALAETIVNETKTDAPAEQTPAPVVDESQLNTPEVKTLSALTPAEETKNDAPVEAPAAPVVTAPAGKGKTAGMKIEKDREEKNGIKRPSAGGMCRAVWDALDAIKAGGTDPTAKQVTDLAVAKGWNKNNASIEFYQWRKFNGITGRSKKAE